MLYGRIEGEQCKYYFSCERQTYLLASSRYLCQQGEQEDDLRLVLIGAIIDLFELPVEALHESVVHELAGQDLVLDLQVDYGSDVLQNVLELTITAALYHSLQILKSSPLFCVDIDGTS